MKFNISQYMQFLKEQKISEAEEYRAFFTPNYLYKFYSLSEEEGDQFEKRNEERFSTLERNQLWFSHPRFLNDPYEYRGMYLDKQTLYSYGFSEEVLSAVEQEIYNTPVCCFVSNGCDNLPMWANYANNHQGYCVKYKVNNKFAAKGVIYEPKRIPIAKLFADFAQAARNCEKRMGDEKEVKVYATILREMVYIKHESWSSEREFRIALFQKSVSASEKGINVNIDDLGLECVEIIAGYNCSISHVKCLTKIAESLSVPCKKCRLSEVDFTVYDEI